MIDPAKRTRTIELSQIRKMFEVTNPDAINLGIGEPDFDVPENIKKAMIESIHENDTHYTPNKGYIELREEIVNKFKKDNDIKTNPDNIIVTVGASEALYMCAQAFIEKGDEVLLSTAEHHANLVTWQQWCLKTGATLRYFDLAENGDFV